LALACFSLCYLFLERAFYHLNTIQI